MASSQRVHTSTNNAPVARPESPETPPVPRDPGIGGKTGLRLLTKPKLVFRLAQAAHSEFGAHKGTRMAASLAYYTIFSLAPLLVIAIAIAGLAFGDKAAQNAITAQIQLFVGSDSARVIQAMVRSAHKPAQGILATVIGAATLLYGASGIFGEIQDALNTIWNVNSPGKIRLWRLIRSRLLSFGMVLAIGFLLLVSLMVSAMIAAVFTYLGGLIPVPEIVLHVVELIISFLIIASLFAVIFKILPDVNLTWHDVFFGAFVTSVLFTAGKFAIGLYLGKSISASAYGPAGALVLVIAWIYYSALILYFGAEFTRIYATRFGSLAHHNSEDKETPGSEHTDSQTGLHTGSPASSQSGLRAASQKGSQAGSK
jgi:membrane protein